MAVDEPGKLVRLWAHELLRVFHDRLVSDEDKAWFCGTLKDSIDTHMGLRFEDVYEPRPGSDVKRVRHGGCRGAGSSSTGFMRPCGAIVRMAGDAHWAWPRHNHRATPPSTLPTTPTHSCTAAMQGTPPPAWSAP